MCLSWARKGNDFSVHRRKNAPPLSPVERDLSRCEAASAIAYGIGRKEENSRVATPILPTSIVLHTRWKLFTLSVSLLTQRRPTQGCLKTANRETENVPFLVALCYLASQRFVSYFALCSLAFLSISFAFLSSFVHPI